MVKKILPEYVTKRIIEMYSTKALASLDVNSENLPAIAEEMDLSVPELIQKIERAKDRSSHQ